MQNHSKNVGPSTYCKESDHKLASIIVLFSANELALTTFFLTSHLQTSQVPVLCYVCLAFTDVTKVEKEEKSRPFFERLPRLHTHTHFHYVKIYMQQFYIMWHRPPHKMGPVARYSETVSPDFRLRWNRWARGVLLSDRTVAYDIEPTTVLSSARGKFKTINALAPSAIAFEILF